MLFVRATKLFFNLVPAMVAEWDNERLQILVADSWFPGLNPAWVIEIQINSGCKEMLGLFMLDV